MKMENDSSRKRVRDEEEQPHQNLEMRSEHLLRQCLLTFQRTEQKILSAIVISAVRSCCWRLKIDRRQLIEIQMSIYTSMEPPLPHKAESLNRYIRDKFAPYVDGVKMLQLEMFLKEYLDRYFTNNGTFRLPIETELSDHLHVLNSTKEVVDVDCVNTDTSEQRFVKQIRKKRSG